MIKFKKGEIVNCIEDGLHLPCKILSDVSDTDYHVKVLDIQTERKVYVPVSQLDRDLQWKRNEQVKKLGI